MVQKQNRSKPLIISGIFILLIASSIYIVGTKPTRSIGFDGNQAYQDVVYQVGLGARIPGSSAHAKEVDLIDQDLVKAGWQTENQNGQMMGHPYQNIVAKRGSGAPWIILGAHYDFKNDR